MINLLPPEEKRQILAARSNTLLWRYCVVSLLLAVLLLAFVVTIYFLLASAKSTAEQKIADNERRMAEYAPVEKQAAEFKSNLATAKTILGKEGRYGKAAVAIASVVPSGIVLQSLQLDATTIAKPMRLTAMAKTEHDALRLKTSFEQSKLFKDVYLESIQLPTPNQTSGSYPVTINFNATLVPGELPK